MRTLILIIFIKLVFVSAINADWVKLNNYPASTAKDLIAKNGVLYAGSMGGGFSISYDNGATWEQRNNGLTTTRAKTIHAVESMNYAIYIATTDGIFKSSDEGISWVAKNNGIQIGPGAIYHFAYSLFEDGPALYAGTFNAIYKSTDNGDAWIPQTQILSHNDFCAFHKYESKLIAGTNGNHVPLIYTTNAGANWTNIPINGGFPTGAFTIYSEPGKLFVGTIIGMWFSSNGGTNWVRRDNGLGADPYVFSLVKAGNTLFAGTNDWVYKSTNDGLNWAQSKFSGQTFQDVNKVIVHNNRIYAATQTGIWYLNEVITNVRTPSNAIPGEFKLLQNYPNPFNPSTKIEYQILKESNVQVKIYDFTGKELMTLVNEVKSAGNYTIDFNASSLSSGVYFYKLETDGFESTRKMILMK